MAEPKLVYNRLGTRGSMEITYEIDSEPLIEISNDRSYFQSENPNESMVSDAYGAKIENYQLILEHEEKLRKCLEKKHSEILESYKLLQNSSSQIEVALRARIEDLHLSNMKLASELTAEKFLCEKYKAEVESLGFKIELLTYEVSSAKLTNFEEDSKFYKGLYEKNEKKLSEFIEKIENNCDDDPINKILKEKDEKIAELKERLKNLHAQDIESRLQNLNARFSKEKELVYTVNGIKVAITSVNDALIFKRIGVSVTSDDFFNKTVHKRSVSDIKVDYSATQPIKKAIIKPNIAKISKRRT